MKALRLVGLLCVFQNLNTVAVAFTGDKSVLSQPDNETSYVSNKDAMQQLHQQMEFMDRHLMNLDSYVRALQMDSNKTSLRNTATNASTHRTPQIAFYGSLRSTVVPTKGEIIKFNNVITNIGHPYNPRTGVFTCPVGGLYQFSIPLFAQAWRGTAGLEILLNGRSISRPMTSREDAYEGTSETAAVHANKGDNVIVRMTFDSVSPGIDQYSRFSGVLLQTD